jgi:dipeptidase D
MSVLADLEPRVIMDFFDTLTRIPRGSENEKGVSDWVVQFATDRGLSYHQDDLHCVLVRKPGTPGYEDAPTVILHGHLDMVCAKEDGVEFDFLTQPLNLLRDGDYVTADGTSLGADNGIGVSYILALLDSTDIPHPPLEAVLTSMEEKGKVGGANFDTSLLRGTRMIDFNWITDKEILAGCGGDVSATIDVPASWEPTDDPNLVARSLQVRGLNGGHCEFDIHLERINAILLLARALNAMLAQGFDLRIDAPRGGAQNNVIAADAEVTVVLPASDADALEVAIKDVVETVANEYEIADPDVRIDLGPAELPERVFSRDATRRLTRSIVLLPNGVVSWSLKTPGIVECSSNLGTVRPTDDGCQLMVTITAGVTSRKHDVLDRMRALAALAGNGVKLEQYGHDAPEFPFVEDSDLLRLAQEAYRRSYGTEPEVHVSNCSLELGMFSGRLPGLETISIGTELHWLHSPAEKFSISSVQGTWKFITTLIPTLR